MPWSLSLSKRLENSSKKSFWGSILLGMVFALAFCPYSGVLYFGMLIPLTITSAKGLILPFIFAIATGIPVIIMAWIIAYSVGSIGKFYDKIKSFEIWFRRIVAIVFILVGVYYLIILVM